VYTPNLKYQHLTSEIVSELHQECFRQYYFRWKYLGANWQFLFPRLHRLVSAISVRTQETSRVTLAAAPRGETPAGANETHQPVLKPEEPAVAEAPAPTTLIQLQTTLPQRKSA